MKKRTMKLLFTGLLAAILLAGCGSNSDNNNDTAAPTEEPSGAEDVAVADDAVADDAVADDAVADDAVADDAVADDAVADDAVVDLVIKASNWDFDQEVYEVAAGSTVQLSIENTEGYHGLLVKGLNLEVVPNKPVTFVAEPGEYEIVCSIQCGVGHNDMKTTLVVN